MSDSPTRAETTNDKLRQSAAVLRTTAHEQVDAADRRTELAADRTVLAAERTYAAWVRTGLAALASGIGARALLTGLMAPWIVKSTGAMLVLFAAFCFVAAVWREVVPRVGRPRPAVRRLPTALLLFVNGFLVVVACAAFVGVLSGR